MGDHNADVDLVIDYALLHEVAGNVREIKRAAKDDIDKVGTNRVLASSGPGSAETVDRSAIGDDGLYGALSGFYTTCHTPFHDAMDKLDQLADTFDSVAKAYFDADSDFASKTNLIYQQLKLSEWESAKAEWDRYQRLKDKTRTQILWEPDADGNLVRVERQVPVWSPDVPPPKDPGAPPTSAHNENTKSDVTLNDKHQVTSETSTVTGPNGLTYTETTTYTYNDKGEVTAYQTTITHSDGKTEVIDSSTGADGVTHQTSKTDQGTTTTTTTPKPGGGGYVEKTEDPDHQVTTVDVTDNPTGKDHKRVEGPDGVTEYEGDAETQVWTEVSHESSSSSDIPYTQVTI